MPKGYPRQPVIYHVECSKCGTEITSTSGSSGQKCLACRQKTCPECGKPHAKRKLYCSRSCGNSAGGRKRSYPRNEAGRTAIKLASQRLAASPRGKELARMHSERMLVQNPMQDLRTIAKMVKTKTANGTLIPQKPWQGGNGRELGRQQQALLKALPGGVPEYSIITTSKLRQTLKAAHCYKADIALPQRRLVIEIDGSTHNSAQAKVIDAKKDHILSLMGWRVLRVTNRQVDREFEKTLARILLVAKSMPICTT